MNTVNDTFVNRLEEAAREGNIDLFYEVIDEKPDVLEHWDVNQFVQTPLHIAASAGHLQFADEIMRLKPSFALKLNKQGFSPIHLALYQGQTRMAQRFVDINKDLVRVKGREGVTPLHLVSQNGDINMLTKFLLACPDSIQDVNVRSETALHIAVKNRQHEALEVLVGWIKTTSHRDAIQLEKEILNWKDEEGNTILHILTLLNDSQALEWLRNSRIDLQAKNIENLTALDIAATEEIKVILEAAGAKHGSSIVESPTLAHHLRLEEAAREGNIDLFYEVIDEKPDVLEHWDVKQFAQTPLHIAASAGHLQFADEIMRLKPSFALKLNKQGFSPIHLALHQGQTRMAMYLVDINIDLVRVKGREGVTPLHLVCQNGDINMLTRFLLACPDSIQDLTVRRETAFHIAVKNRQHEVLEVLVGWLKTNCQIGATSLERGILNWKDEEGNTILHILTHFNDSQVVEWLIYKRINLQTKNRENKTALDIAATPEMKVILANAGAKHGSSLVHKPSRRLRALRSSSRMKLPDQILYGFRRFKMDMLEDQRNAFLVVATLIAGISYQIVGNPPGGFYQSNDGGGYNKNTTSSFNNTAPTIMKGEVGTSVLQGHDLVVFIGINAGVFSTSLMTIFALLPGRRASRLLFVPMLMLSLSFYYSATLICTHTVDLFIFPTIYIYITNYSEIDNSKRKGEQSIVHSYQYHGYFVCCILRHLLPGFWYSAKFEVYAKKWVE